MIATLTYTDGSIEEVDFDENMLYIFHEILDDTESDSLALRRHGKQIESITDGPYRKIT